MLSVRRQNCLGISAPNRDPLPAATIMLMIRGGVIYRVGMGCCLGLLVGTAKLVNLGRTARGEVCVRHYGRAGKLSYQAVYLCSYVEIH